MFIKDYVEKGNVKIKALLEIFKDNIRYYHWKKTVHIFKQNTEILQQCLIELFQDSGNYTTLHTVLISKPHNYNLNIQFDLQLQLCTASEAYFSGLFLHMN